MTEQPQSERYLTTTQAAELLHVAPDTVLKWVRAGKIRSYKTLGGHFRIPISAIEGTHNETASRREKAKVSQQMVSYQYCWEYFARDKEFNPECLECITYRSGSKRCYELRDLPDGLGCLGVYCVSSCDVCDYYRLVKGQGPNIMIVSSDSSILKEASQAAVSDGLLLKFVKNEYECAAALEKFRPDCIVIDGSFGSRRIKGFCQNLFDDPRMPVVRIVLASKKEQTAQYCDREVYGWIKKPFSIQQLRDCIKGM
jgi:excisionase family DNA binding protein